MRTASELKEFTQNLRVLYVEDDQLLQETIAEYLRMLFADVALANNGLEGLELYKGNSFDIVITDINMPQMDGLEMATKIKEIDPEQHIVIISAYKDLNNYIEAIRLGIDGYVLKPVEYEQVNAILYKVASQVFNAKENIRYQKDLEKLVAEKTQKLKEHYVQDSLTGLANKRSLEEFLLYEGVKTFILLNIDNFKMINYNFGFQVGDLFLQEIAQQLKKLIQPPFTLFRLQGDEFGLCAKGELLGQAQKLAQEIKEYFNSYFITKNGICLNITFTIAIDSSASRDLVQSTALWVQELHETGKNIIGTYQADSEFEQNQQNNLYWIEQIKEYIKQDRLKVHFQPIQNMQDQTIQKYEVLTRIISKDGTMVMPHEFLHSLALSGVVTQFTRRVIYKAFEKLRGTDYNISINITSQDLLENYLITYLEEKCQEFRIQRSQIIIEVLESVSTINDMHSLHQLQRLKKLGYKIAIDDFGSEHSNFGRLLTLNVDFIKIDGSFIKNLHKDTNAQEIVKAITAFAHNVGSKVIAEYVHNEEVYKTIKALEIDFAQGYYISEPIETFYQEELV